MGYTEVGLSDSLDVYISGTSYYLLAFNKQVQELERRCFCLGSGSWLLDICLAVVFVYQLSVKCFKLGPVLILLRGLIDVRKAP